LLRLALRLTDGARQDAEDLVQETFLRAARRFRGVPPAGLRSTEAWLARVLVNLVRDRSRRDKVRRVAAERREDVGPATQRATTPGPAESALARHDLRRALARLPARRRAVLVMHELEELDSGEIARLLGIARATVRWHLAAGRTELARALGAGRGEDDAERI